MNKEKAVTATTIVVNPTDRRIHDLWIEPSAAVRAEGVDCLDPQHGGSRLRSFPSFAEVVDRPLPLHDGTEAPPCAATAALQVPGSNTWSGRICLREDAGLDDYAAAAILSARGLKTYPLSPETRGRLGALARADNASYAGLGPWAPGQRLHDVTGTFPGLARLCACKGLPPELRVELVGTWLETGDVYRCPVTIRSREAQRELLGDANASKLSHSANLFLDQDGFLDLNVLDELARADLAAGRKAMETKVHTDAQGRPLLAVVRSELVGLSAGRGALAVGYEHAPVAMAYSPVLETCECGGTGRADDCFHGRVFPNALQCQGGCDATGRRPTGNSLVTVARATNAAGQVELDWTGLRDALNALEPGWGGNIASLILGSPKPQGTRLDLDFIEKVVLDHVRWLEAVEEEEEQ